MLAPSLGLKIPALAAAGKKKGVRYVDLFREPDKDPFELEPQRYYAADWFHPSGEGYRDWYDHIKAKLPKLPTGP